MAESKKKTLKVAAPQIQVRVGNGRVQHMYKGDVLPDEVSDESIEHLKSLGFVTEDDVSHLD